MSFIYLQRHDSLYWLLKNSELFALLGISEKRRKKRDVGKLTLPHSLSEFWMSNYSQCSYLTQENAYCIRPETTWTDISPFVQEQILERERKIRESTQGYVPEYLPECLGSSPLQACWSLWAGLIPSNQKPFEMYCGKSPKLRGALEPLVRHRPSWRSLLPMVQEITSDSVRNVAFDSLGSAIGAASQRRSDVKCYKWHCRRASGLVAIHAVKCMVCIDIDLTQLNNATAVPIPGCSGPSCFMHSCLLLKL